MANTISSFKGTYSWLSNFAPCTVVLDNHTYPSVEHAYQAAKFSSDEKRRIIRDAPTASEAKKLSNVFRPLRKDWESVKLQVMRDLVRQKFDQEPYRTYLLETGTAELIEGNWWNDTFWGVCRGKGENHLGKILMKTRAELSDQYQE